MVFEDCHWENPENFRIRFNGDGSIAILSGSTTLNFADGSVFDNPAGHGESQLLRLGVNYVSKYDYCR